jgi:hypothetical protein
MESNGKQREKRVGNYIYGIKRAGKPASHTKRIYTLTTSERYKRLQHAFKKYNTSK